MNRSLSIVIPAYDEEKRLPGTLERITSYLKSGKWKFSEVIVVDDGSRDGTLRVVEEFRARVPSVRVLRNPGNRGKGYSVRHGMMEAKGDWTLFTDADLSTPIEELEKVWTAAQESKLTRRAKFSAVSALSASGSTWKCCSSRASSAIPRSRCRCDGTM